MQHTGVAIGRALASNDSRVVDISVERSAVLGARLRTREGWTE